MITLAKQLRITRKDQDDIVIAKGTEVTFSTVGRKQVIAYVVEDAPKQVVVAINIGQELLDGYGELQPTVPKKVQDALKGLLGSQNIRTGSKKKAALKDLATRIEHLGNASTTIAMPSKKKLDSSLRSFDLAISKLNTASNKASKSPKGKQLLASYKATLTQAINKANKGGKLNVKVYDFAHLAKVLRLLANMTQGTFLQEGDGTEAAILKLLKPLASNKNVVMSKTLTSWLKG